jgi:hypothetical protein
MVEHAGAIYGGRTYVLEEIGIIAVVGFVVELELNGLGLTGKDCPYVPQVIGNIILVGPGIPTNFVTKIIRPHCLTFLLI